MESLRDRGVDVCGIDVSDYALENVRHDVKPYCANASADAEQALANLCIHTDDVIFSSTCVATQSENRGLRKLWLERQAELANASARIGEMKGELHAAAQELELARTTATWRLAYRMARVINVLLPTGTRRRALAGRIQPKLATRGGDRLS